MTHPDIVVALADGNPGAVAVMVQLYQSYGIEAVPLLLRLDSMGIYGPQIWIAYKDHCGEDINKLAERIRENDMALKQERVPGR